MNERIYRFTNARDEKFNIIANDLDSAIHGFQNYFAGSIEPKMIECLGAVHDIVNSKGESIVEISGE